VVVEVVAAQTLDFLEAFLDLEVAASPFLFLHINNNLIIYSSHYTKIMLVKQSLVTKW
jgi:hypothetical protein